MLHIASHLLVPLVVSVLYRPRWLIAAVLMVSTLLVDLDHLLATPIYDPNRCSIGFHPLHTTPGIAIYGAVFVIGLVVAWTSRGKKLGHVAWAAHLVGLGLIIHMFLDWTECLL